VAISCDKEERRKRSDRRSKRNSREKQFIGVPFAVSFFFFFLYKKKMALGQDGLVKSLLSTAKPKKKTKILSSNSQSIIVIIDYVY
jgi:hypothetical protein